MKASFGENPVTNICQDILFTPGASHPNRLAISSQSGTLSYADLCLQVSSLAVGFAERDFRVGDRCLLILPNDLPFVVCHFGCLAAGGISVPVEPMVSPNTLREILKTAEPKVIVTTKKLYRKFNPVLEECCSQLILVDGDEFDSLIKPDGNLAQCQQQLPSITSDQIASILFTTGSTGIPKGVTLKHANVLFTVRNLVRFLAYSENDRELIVLPLNHSFGLGHLYCNLMAGGAAYLENGLLRAGKVLETLETFSATGFPMTPAGIGLLIDRYGSILAEKAKNLRFMVINSAPLPPQRTEQLHQLLPDTEILVYYGLTEASRTTFISLTKMGSEFYRSVGRSMPGIEMYVGDEQTGRTVRPGEVGEVIIQGPSLSPGYWRNQELTAKVFRNSPQGIEFHTGDCGTLDDSGNLFITGRLNDLINVGGYKVNPVEVEHVIAQIEGIKDVVVVGVVDWKGMSSEALICIYVADKIIDPVTIISNCSLKLEHYKVPVEVVRVDSIPRSNTGKIKRFEVAQRCIDLNYIDSSTTS